MDPRPTPILIGPRGCGKTTIGRAAAAALDWEFVDLDARTLALLGAASTHEAWARAGEPGWRAAEAQSLAAVLSKAQGSPRVVALGGGTPTIASARETLMRERRAGRALIVYLRVPLPDLVARRAAEAEDRPALRPGESIEEE